MGSNFAKYKRIPEYRDFIQPACDAEIHFKDGKYPQCAERCRNSMQMFFEYLYRTYGWKKPRGKYRKHKPSLAELMETEEAQEFLKKKGAKKHTYSKKLGNDATHQPSSETTIKDACEILEDLFYLITKSFSGDDTKKFVHIFAGTPRFDISLLTNSFRMIIEPQLTIEVNGEKTKIPQNRLLKAVISKKVTENIIKENLSLINKTDLLGNTPLSLAIYNDDFTTVKLLLENGAESNFCFSKDFFASVIKDEYVWSEYFEAHRCIPLIIAIKKDNVAILKLLLEYSAKTWDSCIDDKYSLAKIYPECSTLLGSAIFYSAKKCIRYLLINDICDVNEEMKSGVTPLLLAVESNVFVEKLLEKGAKIDFCDGYRNSVFLHAIQNMRHDYELLEKLLEKAKSVLTKDDFEKLINHAGEAGCPISYMNKDELELFLEYGADINAKNEMGAPCVVDVAYLNPDYLPCFKEKGAQFDFKAFFYGSSNLQIKGTDKNQKKYKRSFFTEVLKVATKYDVITSADLNFTVPIDNILTISPLVDSLLFTKMSAIQDNIETKKPFLSDSQIRELKGNCSFFNIFSECSSKFSSYSGIEGMYNEVIEFVKEGIPDWYSQKEPTYEELKKLPKKKRNISIDMSLEEVFQVITSIRELSKKQRLSLLERYPFIKDLERRGIEYNIPEEVESKYNSNDWKMSPYDIISAVREIKTEILYEDLRISPLDDALITKNFEAAEIYLKNGIFVSELSKLLLLNIYDVADKDLCVLKQIPNILKSRKDIDFSSVLINLCKNHPKEDFDIAEEFINNGYNFYSFVHNLLPDFYDPFGNFDCNYETNSLSFENEDVRKRNNSSFLSFFCENSFQDVNLRLIKNAILFGANPNVEDENHKTALDYAKENGIDEVFL